MSVSDAHQVITGHRSNPNCIISHPHLPLFYSSGVEKIVKMHSPFPLPPPISRDRPIPITTNVTSGTIWRRLLGVRDEVGEDSEEDPETIAMFDFLNARERTVLDLVIIRAMETDSMSDEEDSDESEGDEGESEEIDAEEEVERGRE